MKPPVLFIHGAFTRAARWDAWVAHFSEAGFDCVAESLPAHEPPDPGALATTTFQDYLDFVLTIADRFERPPIVVGHSMGGLLAQHLAARRECAALVLLAASPPWRVLGRPGVLPFVLRYVLPAIAGRPILASPAVARRLVLHDLAPAEQDELLKLFTWESGRAYRAMVLGHMPLERGAVTCPVLCVSGGEDRLISLAAATRLAAFHNAEHIVFPNHGHALIAGSLTTMVGGAVTEWLDRTLAGAAAEGSFQAAAVV